MGFNSVTKRSLSLFYSTLVFDSILICLHLKVCGVIMNIKSKASSKRIGNSRFYLKRRLPRLLHNSYFLNVPISVPFPVSVPTTLRFFDYCHPSDPDFFISTSFILSQWPRPRLRLLFPVSYLDTLTFSDRQDVMIFLFLYSFLFFSFFSSVRSLSLPMSYSSIPDREKTGG